MPFWWTVAWYGVSIVLKPDFWPPVSKDTVVPVRLLAVTIVLCEHERFAQQFQLFTYHIQVEAAGRVAQWSWCSA